MQQAVPHSTVFTPVMTNQNQPQQPSLTAPTLETTEDSDSDTFTLDFDL